VDEVSPEGSDDDDNDDEDKQVLLAHIVQIGVN